jgi:aminomethyltransferase
MKLTAFNAIHHQLGGKLIEFGGYEMPVQYAGIMEEHRCVRTAVGVFDVSHMGEFIVKGPDALALVQKISVNDAAKLVPGKAQYSAMCLLHGGIVDDLLVYRFPDHFMLVVNAANTKKDFDWVKSNTAGLNVSLTDRSDEFSLLAIQGPKSIETLQKLTSVKLLDIPYYSFVEGILADERMTISRTGYTGEPGFEIYFRSDIPTGERVWRKIFEAGANYGIKPIGLGARDTLRLEMGYCLYGNDIDETTNPLEAGLGWITKIDKGEFNGRDALRAVKTAGLKRRLVGFTVGDQRALPRHGYEIRSDSGLIGGVTSGTISPTLEKGIGMGYVSTDYAEVGNKIGIQIRGKSTEAEIVKLPFVKK